MTLPVWTRFSFPAALLAAFFFVSALLLAVLLVPGYVPSQHPVSLLGTLPGSSGGMYRWLLFIVPGLLLGVSCLCLPLGLVAGRAGRIGQQLGVIAALGYMLMGVVGIQSSTELESAMRGQAVAWLLWLSAALAASALWAVDLLRHRRARVAAACALVGLLLLVTSLLPLPGLAAPVAQPLAWLIWMLATAGLARVGAHVDADGPAVDN